jgi:hypothetical protein
LTLEICHTKIDSLTNAIKLACIRQSAIHQGDDPTSVGNVINILADIEATLAHTLIPATDDDNDNMIGSAAFASLGHGHSLLEYLNKRPELLRSHLSPIHSMVTTVAPSSTTNASSRSRGDLPMIQGDDDIHHAEIATFVAQCLRALGALSLPMRRHNKDITSSSGNIIRDSDNKISSKMEPSNEVDLIHETIERSLLQHYGVYVKGVLDMKESWGCTSARDINTIIYLPALLCRLPCHNTTPSPAPTRVTSKEGKDTREMEEQKVVGSLGWFDGTTTIKYLQSAPYLIPIQVLSFTTSYPSYCYAIQRLWSHVSCYFKRNGVIGDQSLNHFMALSPHFYNTIFQIWRYKPHFLMSLFVFLRFVTTVISGLFLRSSKQCSCANSTRIIPFHIGGNNYCYQSKLIQSTTFIYIHVGCV